jgi:uncharacterized membrane protein (DUF485 family)
MTTTPRDLLESHDFRRLVSRRWVVSIVLTVLLFVVYYGYILLIAASQPLMARRVGEGVMTVGIPLGVLVILVSWALTAVYVVWANRVYDAEVGRLRQRVGK